MLETPAVRTPPLKNRSGQPLRCVFVNHTRAGACGTLGPGVETLLLNLDAAKDHGQAGQEHERAEQRPDDGPDHEHA